MKQTSVFTAFTAFCLCFIDGAPVLEDNKPSIIGLNRVHMTAHPGNMMVLHCDAFTNQDVTLIYWLVNGTFPEDTTSSERIVELDESTAMEGKILQRSLLLKKVTPEDFRSKFTCVVTNSYGAAHKVVKLTQHSLCSNKVIRQQLE